MATTYPVTLLQTSTETPQTSEHRPFIFPNSHHITTASHGNPPPSSNSDAGDSTTTAIDPAIETFHRSLPSYAETRLHHLPALAATLGLGGLYLKDEGTRFGLPAFKILGASWAVHRAVCRALNLDPFTTKTVAEVRDAVAVAAARSRSAKGPTDPEIRLVTCTEGNWGRAVARMARDLHVRATIYVPGFMSGATRELIQAEDPELVEVVVLREGSYDDCIAATRRDAERTGALMVMDTSWEGYEEVPQWVTDGYTTMLTETDRQIATSSPASSPAPNTFVVSVGVGSWAHAVVQHYNNQKSPYPHLTRILTVEPTAAPCLAESLHRGALTSVVTGHTIMAGMCCGTPSRLAWPVLRDGVTASVVVTEGEAHRAVGELREHGVEAGPCGAATWAAVKKWAGTLGETERREAVVVLFSTEGRREYEVPVVEG